MPYRPELPIPAALLTTQDWHFIDESLEPPFSPSSAYIVESPSVVQPPHSPSAAALPVPHPLSREASEDDSFISDPSNAQSSTMSPKLPSLPDPSQYPDPYPFRPPRWNHGISTPTLSSADSSSGSTRSSAYTSSARSGDYGHVHVALGLDDSNMSMGISTDDVARILARESGPSSASQRTRTPYAEENRWSDRYSQSVRSRSSSIGGRGEVASELGSPALRPAPSFDQGWASVDERDEMGLTTDDETDDDGLVDEEDVPGEVEEATSAMMVAEEGRGIIVRGGEGPVVQLQVKPGMSPALAEGMKVMLSATAFRRHDALIDRIVEHA